jgi:hypothetical protein
VCVEHTRHGNIRVTAVDQEFVHSGDYAQIRSAAETLRGLVGPGAIVQRGDKQHPVKDFGEAMKWLLGEVQKSVSLQRYKGLGEMNPAQLWQTTMDPTARRLLRVQIEDGIAADEIFTADGRRSRAAARLHRVERARARNLDIRRYGASPRAWRVSRPRLRGGRQDRRLSRFAWLFRRRRSAESRPAVRVSPETPERPTLREMCAPAGPFCPLRAAFHSLALDRSCGG